MAQNEYITITDITHAHLKQFPDVVLQTYVDEANDWYEDLGLQKQVVPEDLAFPVSIVSRRCLSNYVVSRFAEDSIGSNNIEISDDDMYVRMADEFKVIYEGLKVQLTPELMRGVSDANPKSRSVSTGKLYRTA